MRRGNPMEGPRAQKLSMKEARAIVRDAVDEPFEGPYGTLPLAEALNEAHAHGYARLKNSWRRDLFAVDPHILKELARIERLQLVTRELYLEGKVPKNSTEEVLRSMVENMRGAAQYEESPRDVAPPVNAEDFADFGDIDPSELWEPPLVPLEAAHDEFVRAGASYLKEKQKLEQERIPGTMSGDGVQSAKRALLTAFARFCGSLMRENPRNVPEEEYFKEAKALYEVVSGEPFDIVDAVVTLEDEEQREPEGSGTRMLRAGSLAALTFLTVMGSGASSSSETGIDLTKEPPRMYAGATTTFMRHEPMLTPPPDPFAPPGTELAASAETVDDGFYGTLPPEDAPTEP